MSTEDSDIYIPKYNMFDITRAQATYFTKNPSKNALILKCQEV